MVEGGEEPDLARQQHAVAEDVARHVADADDREGRRLDVDIHLAEMALDRFPGAARGDAHLLVVVAGRAAGREGIVEPEAVLGGNGVGDVGEGRGALVGGDDEIGIVAVAPHRIRRRHDFVALEIVGEVEQARDEALVDAHPLRLDRHRADAPDGMRFGTKPPLAPTGTITAFLTFCALASPSTSVRKSSGRSDQRMPPRAIGPAAQMHALDIGRIDEDFGKGLGLRQAFDLLAVDLEGDERRLAVALWAGGRNWCAGSTR